MGGGHSAPAYIPQKILYNPIVINKSSNPSSFNSTPKGSMNESKRSI